MVAGQLGTAKQEQPQSSSDGGRHTHLLSDANRLHRLTDSLMTLVTNAQAITFASSPRAMLCISQRLGLAAKYQIVNTCMHRVPTLCTRGLSRGTWVQHGDSRLACCACREGAVVPSACSQAWPWRCVHRAGICTMPEVCEQQAVSAKMPSTPRCMCQMSAAGFVGGRHS